MKRNIEIPKDQQIKKEEINLTKRNIEIPKRKETKEEVNKSDVTLKNQRKQKIKKIKNNNINIETEKE